MRARPGRCGSRLAARVIRGRRRAWRAGRRPRSRPKHRLVWAKRRTGEASGADRARSPPRGARLVMRDA
ncbi:hypothetical protein AQ741_21820 [Burkholderia pseudomallei]|nr:hypothetical protein AQ741_21820 [Burkholderia pseudomallei]